MPAASSIIQAIARAYFAREQARLGITEQRAAARRAAVGEQQAGSADLVRQAQLQKMLQAMGFAPEEHDARLGLIKAQTAAAEARGAAQPKRIERTVDLGNRQRVYYTDGTTEDMPKGAAPRAPGMGGGEDGGLASNPITVSVKDKNGQVTTRLAARVKGGGLQFIDEIGGEKVGPGPTAEMRNTEYQGGAVEPAFELVRQSLDGFEQAAKGGLPGAPSAIIPGTDAYYAKGRFVDQAKALLGAIVARQAGEGSRLSDEDRRSYSQAATLVNSTLMLPGGVEEARARIDEAETLLKKVQKRRRAVGAGGTLDPNDGADVVEFVRGPDGKLVRKR